MDSKGRALDNVFTERLWRTIKYEEVYLKEYASPREARSSLTEYLCFYNERRLHQALDYRTPAEVYFAESRKEATPQQLQFWCLDNLGHHIQLEEIKRISSNVFALIDSERSNQGEELEARRVAFKKICDGANIQCHVLERRAIENYFPDYAVKKVKGDAFRALQPYELFKSTPSFCKWAKSENWQIAKEMVPEDLDNTDLGKFLKSLQSVAQLMVYDMARLCACIFLQKRI